MDISRKSPCFLNISRIYGRPWDLFFQTLAALPDPTERLTHAHTPYIGEPAFWLHLDRVASRHRNHRGSHRTSLARRTIGARGGPPRPVHQQPEADRPGITQLRELQQQLPPHDDPHPDPRWPTGHLGVRVVLERLRPDVSILRAGFVLQ